MSALPTLATRLKHIQPFWVMDLLAQAKALEAQGRAVIHLEIGEPDFPTPDAICAAGIEAISRRHTQYTPALGLMALRSAIASFYGDFYGVQVDPACVVVTPGASGALLLALGLWVEPGRSVMLADPTYPCNRHLVTLLGGELCSVLVGAAENFQLTPTLVQQHWRPEVCAALVATPSNPTGSVLNAEALAALAACVHQQHGALIVDEIYQGLLYDAAPLTALQVDPHAVVVNSFSKYFGVVST
jgi:aspartate/methionine/tyrosine aminotransferase